MSGDWYNAPQVLAKAAHDQLHEERALLLMHAMRALPAKEPPPWYRLVPAELRYHPPLPPGKGWLV